ncbi:MAG: hypothetical protein ACXU9A_10690, partial [Xanthobacteraceae bacterium]
MRRSLRRQEWRRRLLPQCDLGGGLAGHEPDLHLLPVGIELVGEICGSAVDAAPQAIGHFGQTN